MEARLTVENWTSGISALLQVTAPDGAGRTISAELASATGNVLALEIENPQLWWPSGMGAQPLYRVTAVVKQDGVEQDRRKKRSRRDAVDTSRLIKDGPQEGAAGESGGADASREAVTRCRKLIDLGEYDNAIDASHVDTALRRKHDSNRKAPFPELKTAVEGPGEIVGEDPSGHPDRILLAPRIIAR